MTRSYLVILESVDFAGSPVKMEAYQGSNPIEAQIIHGVITGVLHSLKASGVVEIRSSEDPLWIEFRVDVIERWNNGIQVNEVIKEEQTR